MGLSLWSILICAFYFIRSHFPYTKSDWSEIILINPSEHVCGKPNVTSAASIVLHMLNSIFECVRVMQPYRRYFQCPALRLYTIYIFCMVAILLFCNMIIRASNLLTAQTFIQLLTCIQGKNLSAFERTQE